MPTRTPQLLGACVILVAGVVQLGSQSSTPTIVFSNVPTWGQDGQVSGYVYGLNTSQSNLYLFEFLPDLGWFAMNSCPIAIDGTGQFNIRSTANLIDRTATRYTAYLAPDTIQPGCVTEAASIPFLLTHNAIASASIPRLPQDPAVSFGGMTWRIKSPPTPVYPGPQFYTQNNVSIDGLGQLHLRLAQCSSSWCAAEIYSDDAVGYGTYTFSINSQLNNLDPKVTLGLFVWDGQAAEQANREWDIEFGRWGNANATANAQYVIQPYNVAGNLNSFLMSPASSSTHTVTWLPNQISFISTAGTNGGPAIYQWNYPGQTSQIPSPGDAHIHINLYVAVGQAPAQPVAREIVLSKFQYHPLGSQIAFSRNGDNVAASPSNNVVPISGGPGCVASIESDSPWLTPAASAVSAGGSLQYSVTQNLGSSKIGNLILRSTNCSPSVGNQVLTVSQAPLICSPTFVGGSASLGFNGGTRSVAINGTAPVCSWTVSSPAPWLQVLSPNSGAGNGQVQYSVGANFDSRLRQGNLLLNSGGQYAVYQDGNANYLALSPLSASSCGSTPPQFAVSWLASDNVELRRDNPSGTLIGQFGPLGSAMLPTVSDGTKIFLTQLGSGGATVLGSATVSFGRRTAGAAIAPKAS